MAKLSLPQVLSFSSFFRHDNRSQHGLAFGWWRAQSLQTSRIAGYECKRIDVAQGFGKSYVMHNHKHCVFRYWFTWHIHFADHWCNGKRLQPTSSSSETFVCHWVEWSSPRRTSHSSCTHRSVQLPIWRHYWFPTSAFEEPAWWVSKNKQDYIGSSASCQRHSKQSNCDDTWPFALVGALLLLFSALLITRCDSMS